MQTIDVTHLCLDESTKAPLLTAEEEKELGRAIQRGCAASLDKMVVANTRLALSNATKFTKRGLPLVDLFQEAVCGLIMAAKRFDPERGYRFSTYATWWIRQSIQRALADKGQTIRLPVHRYEQIVWLKKCVVRLTNDFGDRPTPAEIAEAMGISREVVAELLTVMNQQPSSLDKLVSDGNDTPFSYWIEDSNALQPEREVEKTSTAEMVNGLLETLTAREAMIVKMRFGFNGYDAMTLREISERFGLTRERIRQIEGDALGRLRRVVGGVNYF